MDNSAAQSRTPATVAQDLLAAIELAPHNALLNALLRREDGSRYEPPAPRLHEAFLARPEDLGHQSLLQANGKLLERLFLAAFTECLADSDQPEALAEALRQQLASLEQRFERSRTAGVTTPAAGGTLVGMFRSYLGGNEQQGTIWGNLVETQEHYRRAVEAARAAVRNDAIVAAQTLIARARRQCDRLVRRTRAILRLAADAARLAEQRAEAARATLSLVPDDLGAETYRRVVAALAVDEQPTESRRQVLNAILDLLGDDLEHLPTPSQVVDAVVAQIASRLSLPVDLPWLLSRLDTGLQERPAEALRLALGELKRALAGRTATQPAIVERSWSAFEIVSPDSAPALRWTGANLQVARFRQRRADRLGLLTINGDLALEDFAVFPLVSARLSARVAEGHFLLSRAVAAPPAAPLPPALPPTSPPPSDSTPRSIPDDGPPEPAPNGRFVGAREVSP